MRYTIIQQLSNAHTIIKKIFDRNKDKRKLLSKGEMAAMEKYLSTSRYRATPEGRIKEMEWSFGKKKLRLRGN